MQDHTGISNAAPSDVPSRAVYINKEGGSGLVPVEEIVEPRIHDHIGSLRFSISPSAFFQVKLDEFSNSMSALFFLLFL